MGRGSEEGEREWGVGVGRGSGYTTTITITLCMVPTCKLHFKNKTTDVYSWHKPPSVSHIDMYTPPTTRGFLYVCMHMHSTVNLLH